MEPLHIVTPLQHSVALSELVPGCEGVYLKMENCQPPGSFKIRGFGRLAQKLKNEGHKHIIVPSSGNTGLAMAYASQVLGMKCTVCVPNTTPVETRQQLRQRGAEVVVGDSLYVNTVKQSVEVSKKTGGFLVNINVPEVWSGHSTLVDELATQLPKKPGVIAASVSDGTLLTGILEGLKRVGWGDVPVLGMETIGADCFNLSVKANKIVEQPEETSVAICLASTNVAPYLWERLPQFNVISEVVTDAQAVESCIRIANDEFVLVEPGCGATLAAVYSGLLSRLRSEGRIGTGPAVMIVCGGRCVSLRLLQEWAKQFNLTFPPHHG